MIKIHFYLVFISALVILREIGVSERVCCINKSISFESLFLIRLVTSERVLLFNDSPLIFCIISPGLIPEL